MAVSTQNAGLTTASRMVVDGLQALQMKVSTAADLVSKADDPDATDHRVNLTARTVDGAGAGVQVASVTRAVNEDTLRQLRDDISDLEELKAENKFYKRLMTLVGSPGQADAISNGVSTLNAAMQRLAASPTDATLQREVINKSSILANRIKSLADEVQELRREADEIVQDAVATINTEAATIVTLNAQIAKIESGGGSAPSLLDERDKSLRKIAELIDLNTFTDETGAMQVRVSSGDNILVGLTANTLSHTAATAYIAGNSMGSITLGGTDIKSAITGGKIKGLIDMVDTILPNLQAELDEFTMVFRDTMNATSNLGTAQAPPQVLTSARTFSSGGATTLSNLAGTLRVAIINNTSGYEGRVVEAVDVDLSSLSANTLTGLVADINAGLTGTVASISSDNELVLTASSSSYGIALISSGSATIESVEPALYLGFNNMFTTSTNLYGDSRTGVANNLAINSTWVSSPTLLPTARISAGAITTQSATTGDILVSPGDSTNIQAMVDNFSSNVSFSSAGTLGAKTTKFQSYAANIVAGVGEAAANTHGKAEAQEVVTEGARQMFSNESGINVTEKLIELQNVQMNFMALARIQGTITQLIEILSTLGR